MGECRVCRDGCFGVRSGSASGRIRRGHFRSQPRVGEPRSRCRYHHPEIRQHALQSHLRAVRRLRGFVGSVVRRVHPLLGVVRVRPRPALFLHRSAFRRPIFQPRATLRVRGRPDAVRLLLQGGVGVHVAHGPPARRHPLPRLANRTRARSPVRDVSTAGHAGSAGLLYDPQFRPSRSDRRTDPLGDRVESARALLRRHALARRRQSVCAQLDEGRDRLLEFRHHRVAAPRVGGPEHRSRHGPRPHAARPSRQVRRRPQRRSITTSGTHRPIR